MPTDAITNACLNIPISAPVSWVEFAGDMLYGVARLAVLYLAIVGAAALLMRIKYRRT